MRADHYPSPMALIPVLSISRCSAPVLGRQGMVTVRSVWRRRKVLKSGTGQSSFARLRRLATSPVVCRRGRPNNAFSIRQVWIAASEKVAGRPGRPLGAAIHSISGSNQINSEPRCFKAAFQARQVVVRHGKGNKMRIAKPPAEWWPLYDRVVAERAEIARDHDRLWYRPGSKSVSKKSQNGFSSPQT